MKFFLSQFIFFFILVFICYFVVLDQRDTSNAKIVLLRDSITQLKTYTHQLQDSLRDAKEDYYTSEDTVFIFKGAVFSGRKVGWIAPPRISFR